MPDLTEPQPLKAPTTTTQPPAFGRPSFGQDLSQLLPQAKTPDVFTPPTITLPIQPDAKDVTPPITEPQVLTSTEPQPTVVSPQDRNLMMTDVVSNLNNGMEGGLTFPPPIMPTPFAPTPTPPLQTITPDAPIQPASPEVPVTTPRKSILARFLRR